MAIGAYAGWMLAQEARSLLTRLARLEPFALIEPTVLAAALMPSAQSAIESQLVQGRRELRRMVAQFQWWLRREQADGASMATAAEAQRRFTFLRLKFNAALTQFDLFNEVITQRSEHKTGVWLAGLDIVAADALALPGNVYQAPPVVCYLDRGPGAAIRRARTRLPGGGDNPVAIIRLPRERMIGSSIASSLVHEVGRQGAAQVIAFGWIKPDVQAKGAASSFVAASGQQAALAPFFTRFLLNCDQWDGYNSERKNLMAHLKNNAIGNVVAITGDIHSFFAGTVSDDFDAAGGGTPVMVDLVSAGVSSDSFFSYLKSAAGSMGDIGTLVSYPLAIPVTGVGTVNLDVNLLDYTMGKAAPSVDSLLEQLRVQLRGALAAKGVPEAQLDATVAAVQAGLKASTDFSVTLLGLAQQLSGLGNNPWIRHLNTDAQGYTVVTLTPGKLVAQFKQVNKLVGTAAPSNVIARVTTATVTAGAAAVVVA
ncbi:Phospholipase D [Janthinobacterium sp. AD80]|nr:Phospholipase D [Janthinobacterium sp. AD80]